MKTIVVPETEFRRSLPPFVSALVMLSFCLWMPAASFGAGLLEEHLQGLPPTFGQLTEYRLQANESYDAAARKFGLSPRALRLANPHLSRHMPLLVPTLFFPQEASPNSLVLNLAERNVYLFDKKGEPAAVFPMAIGRPDWPTPTGEFVIINKAANPTWFPPSWAKKEKPVPPGPENPLGDRWMGLDEPGYGLHATNEPYSVGGAVSHGCIRLYPEHARYLYDRVSIGTRVKIIYETLLIGYSPQTRSVYLAVFPDSYDRGTNSLPRAKHMLRLAGLEGFISDARLKVLLEEASGSPVVLAGSEMAVQINKKALPLALGPTPRGDDYLVGAMELADALGADLARLPDKGWYMLRRGRNRLVISPGRTEAWFNEEPLRLGAEPLLLASANDRESRRSGTLLLPVVSACRALGAEVEIDKQAKVLRIADASSLAEALFASPLTKEVFAAPRRSLSSEDALSPASTLLPLSY